MSGVWKRDDVRACGRREMDAGEVGGGEAGGQERGGHGLLEQVMAYVSPQRGSDRSWRFREASRPQRARP